MKKAVLMVAGAAVQKLMMQLENEQEILINIANMISELYLSESVLLRAEKISINKYETADADAANDMMRVYLQDSMMRIDMEAKNAIAAFADGDELKMMQMGLKRFTKTQLYNTKVARRRICEKLVAANKYCF